MKHLSGTNGDCANLCENRLLFYRGAVNAPLGTSVSFPPESRSVLVKTMRVYSVATQTDAKTDGQAKSWAEFCETFELEPVVYFVGAPNGLVKIGFARDLDVRLGELRSASPVPLRVLAFVLGAGRVEEGKYHARFKEWRRHGEWFELSPEIQAEIDRLSA